MRRSDFERWQRKMIGDSRFTKLSASGRGIVLVLTHYTDDAGTVGAPGRPFTTVEIAKELELAHSTVLNALVKAVGTGLMTQDGERFTFTMEKPKTPKSEKAISEIPRPTVTSKGVTNGVTHSGSSPLSPPPQTPPPLSPEESESEESREESLLRKDASDVPKVEPEQEIPETLEGKLEFVLGRMPHLSKIIPDIQKTVAKLIECYEEDFGEDWLVEQAKAERRWCFAREGKPVLTRKRDGHKTVLNWFRMRADDERKRRRLLAGQEHGRKRKDEDDLDEYLNTEGAA